MKNFILATLTFTGILFFTSCGSADTTFVYRGQTQCSDPWDNSDDDDILSGNVENYLIDQGIEVEDVIIETITSSGIHCAACDCGTDKTIRVEVLNKYVPTMKTLDFTE